jgi:uncharacterized protein
MQHKQVDAAVSVGTDRGEFTAIAAAYSVDRQGEAIRPGAFAATIKAWKASAKVIPLHWNHETGAESIIGSIDPATMRETDDGLYVEGQLDLKDSELAREAWRSLKRNRIGLSFGFLTTDAGQRDDGVKELRAIDLFEVTLTGAPANGDTRVLSAKGVAEREHEVIAAFAEAFAVSSKPDQPASHGKQLADLSFAELKAYGDELTKDIETRPVRIVSFEC